MKKTLIWNGIAAENMSLKIISLPNIQLSTENIEEKEVDGRDGSLTIFKGYSSDTKQVEADYVGNEPQRIISWLKGFGKVVFGNAPDRYYKARINNIVPLDHIIENQMYNFTIQFRCQPFGYLIDGARVLTIKNNTALNHNKANYKSLPSITIYGTGSCTFIINNRTFNISEIGTSITIDSYLQEVYNHKGNQMIGDFPYLDAGENFINWTGVGITKVEITPNWRCL